MKILDWIYLCSRWMPVYIREKRRWSGIAGKSDGPRVFYGFDTLAGPGDITTGGIVKVQDLSTRLPNTPIGANVLYLVSSALPMFAPMMAKIARKAGVKIVVNQNGVAYPGWHGAGWKTTNSSMRELVHLADHVFYQSEFCRLGADKFLGQRYGPSEVLYNPVDTGCFTPSSDASHGDPFVLLVAGSIWEFYRVESAVRALALVRKQGLDATLRIAGRLCWRPSEGEASADVERLCSEFGVRKYVDLAGPYSQGQAVEMYRSARILLHTKYNDPCPRVVVEAMACGLPVVYSSSGGVPELTGNDAGVGIPAPLDWDRMHAPHAEDVASAVLKIAACLPEYSISARNRAVEKFQVRPWLDRHEAVFKTLIA